MKLAIAAIIAAIALPALAYCQTGYFVRSYYRTIGGRSVQVCVYNVMGDEVGVGISTTRVCPMTHQFCD